MPSLTEIFSRLAAAVFPERCVLCGELSGGGLCCIRCEKACAPLKMGGAFAGTAYEGAARKALLRLKKAPDKRLAEFFARLMAAALEAGNAGPFDALVPVPASAEKLKERGFNQAGLLAERLSAHIGAPVLPQALLRRDSLVQHTLDRQKRQENAKTAYAINEAASVKARHILLVDDVVTTGATITACTALLLEAGAKSVTAVAATATR